MDNNRPTQNNSNDMERYIQKFDRHRHDDDDIRQPRPDRTTTTDGILGKVLDGRAADNYAAKETDGYGEFLDMESESIEEAIYSPA